MGAMDRVRDAVSAAVADGARGVRVAASAAGVVARAVHEGHVVPFLAAGDPADAPDPRGPSPWPMLCSEPFCLVRVAAGPADALGILAAAMTETGLFVEAHRDGWGFTSAPTSGAARGGWRYDVRTELNVDVPLPGPFSMTLGAVDVERVHVRSSWDAGTGVTTLRLDADLTGRLTVNLDGTGVARRVADALSAFAATWEARGVSVLVGGWRSKARVQA